MWWEDSLFVWRTLAQREALLPEGWGTIWLWRWFTARQRFCLQLHYAKFCVYVREQDNYNGCWRLQLKMDDPASITRRCLLISFCTANGMMLPVDEKPNILGCMCQLRNNDDWSHFISYICKGKRKDEIRWVVCPRADYHHSRLCTCQRMLCRSFLHCAASRGCR